MCARRRRRRRSVRKNTFDAGRATRRRSRKKTCTNRSKVGYQLNEAQQAGHERTPRRRRRRNALSLATTMSPSPAMFALCSGVREHPLTASSSVVELLLHMQRHAVVGLHAVRVMEGFFFAFVGERAFPREVACAGNGKRERE